jgi:hypothetical protein
VPSTIPIVEGRLTSVPLPVLGAGVGVGVVDGGTWAQAPPAVIAVSAAASVVMRT